ncbi:NUDIX domain-containing protein [Patescibacteria group bacterium]|nr:NUDIX domain-containing protein [Desulfobacteraceae bacterium]MBU4027155.1 NUDIX domain-containing protein [Patescibacteria group bacterium]MBU4069271.1 NUDIX domain-containing protein [Pseudomonadota bacterium]
MLKKKTNNPLLNAPNIQSAHAVLLLDDKYILQLRETKPGIAAPGQWSLFGGMKKTCETLLEAISREIYEELSIQPLEFHYLWFVDYFSAFEGEVVRTWFFCSDVSSVWAEHKLLEGQAVGVFRFEKTSDLEMPAVMRQTIERFHQHAKGYDIL